MKLDKAAIMDLSETDAINQVSVELKIASAFGLEQAIETRGLAKKYTDHLIQLTTGNRNCDLPSWEACWKFLRATPEQRCRAALLAVALG